MLPAHHYSSVSREAAEADCRPNQAEGAVLLKILAGCGSVRGAEIQRVLALIPLREGSEALHAEAERYGEAEGEDKGETLHIVDHVQRKREGVPLVGQPQPEILQYHDRLRGLLRDIAACYDQCEQGALHEGFRLPLDYRGNAETHPVDVLAAGQDLVHPASLSL